MVSWRRGGQRAGGPLNSSTEDVVQNIRRLVPEGVDYVLDAVGVNGIINTAMYLLKENGQICVYGICPEKEMQLSWKDAPQNWTLRFLHVPVKGTAGRGISADCGVGASGKHNIRRLYLSQGTVFTDPGCV